MVMTYDLLITPSVLYSFYLRPEWGVKAYLSKVYGIKQEDNFFTKKGRELHAEFGCDNDVRFYATKVLNIDGKDYVLQVEGTPDRLSPLTELKTTSTSKVKKELEKIVTAAGIQLLGYMFLTNSDYGYVLVVDREKREKVCQVMFFRNDDVFFDYVRKFFIYFWSRSNLSDFVEVEDGPKNI